MHTDTRISSLWGSYELPDDGVTSSTRNIRSIWLDITIKWSFWCICWFSIRKYFPCFIQVSPMYLWCLYLHMTIRYVCKQKGIPWRKLTFHVLILFKSKLAWWWHNDGSKHVAFCTPVKYINLLCCVWRYFIYPKVFFLRHPVDFNFHIT
jgi:hypothetical protein